MYHSIKRTLLFESRKKFYEKDAWHRRASSQATNFLLVSPNATFAFYSVCCLLLFLAAKELAISARSADSNKTACPSKCVERRVNSEIGEPTCRDNMTEHEETDDPRDNPFFPQPFNDTCNNGLARS